MNKGFTLIELLVSMGIVAVLTGMAVFNFNQSRVRARDVSRKSDLSQLQKALELYKNDQGKYPLVNQTPYVLDQTVNLKNNDYIKYIFNDPRPSDQWPAYQYRSDDQKNYYLMACLENTADQTKSTGTICEKFGSDCSCNSSKGVMYIITQP